MRSKDTKTVRRESNFIITVVGCTVGMKLFGQDISVIRNQVHALVLNLYSWFIALFSGKSLRSEKVISFERSCIVIRRPGGYDCLEPQQLALSPGCCNSSDTSASKDEIIATVGYNVVSFPPPFIRKSQLSELPLGLVVVKVMYFSVNYADVCIRWGLYESALKYVGWPIVAGFDFSGVVEISSSPDFNVGDEVFGFTMFGAYSSRLVVPSPQIRRIPRLLTVGHSLPMEQAAGIPAVAATALHAVCSCRLMLCIIGFCIIPYIC